MGCEGTKFRVERVEMEKSCMPTKLKVQFRRVGAGITFFELKFCGQMDEATESSVRVLPGNYTET